MLLLKYSDPGNANDANAQRKIATLTYRHDDESTSFDELRERMYAAIIDAAGEVGLDGSIDPTRIDDTAQEAEFDLYSFDSDAQRKIYLLKEEIVKNGIHRVVHSLA